MNFEQEVIDMTMRHIKLVHSNLTERDITIFKQGVILGLQMGVYSDSSEEIQRYALYTADTAAIKAYR